MLLYEPDNSGYTAVFSFNFSETEITGTWTDIKTNQSLPLHLTFVSKLVDTLDASQFKDVQILQTEALPDFYFVGVYSKTAETNRAKMDKLLIFKSDDNSLFQTIDFAEVEKNTETETGNIMTIIFDNVSIENAERKKLMISNNMDQMNGYLELGYNSKKKKFILNPIPQLGCRE
ncbi:hypothetical protein [Fluviicola sp.]|uniref:hypothetical protein n=1 Tax=Fluviicola sp. TaxID=1917219 RepID=UPI0028325238|nr:hypothetical protein [Fluviicola sp.]MDR0800959.1 hypothetical protein [Fluviicola sp.]